MLGGGDAIAAGLRGEFGEGSSVLRELGETPVGSD
jgi:hypothetical protein